MARVRAEGIPLVAPTLALPEVAATIARTTGDPDTAQRFAEVASEHRLRGSDAAYGAGGPPSLIEPPAG